jgi:hypothetical protein
VARSGLFAPYFDFEEFLSFSLVIRRVFFFKLLEAKYGRFLVILVSGKASVIAFGTVRVLKGKGGGEVWFVAKDVCDALGMGNVSETLRGLDEDEKITIRITEGNPRRGIPHSYVIINESGLYSLSFWMMTKDLPVQ